jgi:PAS domain S-box-containing protein
MNRLRTIRVAQSRKSDNLPVDHDYASMLDLANDTIMIRNLDDEIVYWNQGAERLYGWSKEEAIGKYVHTFLKTTFPKPLKEIFAEFLPTGHWEGLLEHTTKDGTCIVVSSRWTLQRAENQKPKAYLEINNDITVQRLAEKALHESQIELERRVEERTKELTTTNRLLLEQIAERQRAEDALKDLSLRLISAQEDERRRISQDLHDDLGQILTYVTLDLERAKNAAEPDKKNDLITNVLNATREAREHLRELSAHLRPRVLDEIGLKAAIQTNLAEFSQRSGIRTKFQFQCKETHLTENVKGGIYRIFQEALLNVLKHAHAKMVSISVKSQPMNVLLEIEDDGIGFQESHLSPGRKSGLSAMRERAELLGGSFRLQSSAKDGTNIVVIIPADNQNDD